MDDSSTLILMDTSRIERSLKRIAHQVSEDNKNAKDIVILGINYRGYAVASFLKNYLSALTGTKIGCHQILLEKEEIKGAPSLQNKYVLLVDDVIFSGTTMFRALNLISRAGVPDEIHTAALIDRGHRKFPVSCQFVGIELPTKLDEHVDVEVKDEEPHQVLLSQSMY